jgi:hypothetical protein
VISDVDYAWCADGSPLYGTVTGSQHVGGEGVLLDNDGKYCTAAPFGSAPWLSDEGDIVAPEGTGAQVRGSLVARVGSTKSLGGVPLSCDPGDPCDLGVSVDAKAGSTFYNYLFAVPVTYGTASVSACHGEVGDPLEVSGPDRLDQAFEDWALGACRQDAVGGGAAPAIYDGTGEAQAVGDFEGESADIAFTGGGAGVPGLVPASASRAYVAVPVALDAVVLALGNAYAETAVGGDGTALGWWTQGTAPQLTLDELAYLLASCAPEASSTLGSKIVAAVKYADPLWKGAPTDLTADDNNSPTVYGISATTGTASTTYLATRFLDAEVPSDMNTGEGCEGVDREASDNDKALQVTSDFALASPAYDVQGYTGYAALEKFLTPHANDPMWVLTDAATAAKTWGGLEDVDLQAPGSLTAASPDYVGPTEQAMDAAVADMTLEPDGTLLPATDPLPPASGSSEGVEPYPLTFVEYALVPAAPLLNQQDCTEDTAKQQLLDQWLDYITSPAGQAELPAGLQQLPQDLMADAQEAIAKVGTAPLAVTGTSCAEPPGAPTGLTATAGTGGEVQLSWSAPPSSTGATPITGYEVVVTGPEELAVGTGSAQTTFDLTGLSDPGSYSIAVEAMNAAGAGPPSQSATVAVAATATTTTTVGSVATTTSVPGTAPVPTSGQGPVGGALPPLVTGDDFGTVVSAVVQAGAPLTLSTTFGGADASALVPAGALAAGTTVYLVPVVNADAFTSYLPKSQSYIAGFDVSWQGPDGSSPAASVPVTLTITDSSMEAGDTVYEMTGTAPGAIGTTTVPGGVTVPFEGDPIFFVAGPSGSLLPPSLVWTGTTPSTAPPRTSPGTTATGRTSPFPTSTVPLTTAVPPTTGNTSATSPMTTPPMTTPTTGSPGTAASFGTTTVPSGTATSQGGSTVPTTTGSKVALATAKIPGFGGRAGGDVLFGFIAAVVLVLLVGGFPVLAGRGRPGGWPARSPVAAGEGGAS